MYLLVDRFGAFLGKKSERLQIQLEGKVVEEYPFLHLEGLIIASKGISISTDLLSALMENGIMTYITSVRGEPVALISSPALHATISTRRKQLLATSEPISTKVSKAIVKGKLTNQAFLLKYFSKYRRGDKKIELLNIAKRIIDSLKEIEKIKNDPIEFARDEILNIEAVAGKFYWQGVNIILGESFKKREHRGAKDPVNSCLNYGYGILYGRIWQAVILAGLEPFAGLLHTDRSGRPSLILDLIEEFRQFTVDRTVISIFTKKRDIEIEKDGLLTEKSRRLIAEKVLERLDTPHSFMGKKYTMSSIIQIQARNLATAIREDKGYKPFIGKW